MTSADIKSIKINYLITFKNSLEQGQDGSNFSTDLDPNHEVLIFFLKDF